MTPTVVLQTQGLTKHFGDLTAVDGLTLEVYEGEVFGLLGPNGAGKTTSINMMCGLLAPDAGTVWLHNQPVLSESRALKATVGVCPQEIVLWERLTCLEQLVFIGQMYGLNASTARHRGEELLEVLDLEEKSNVQARRLSGGMQRRLNLAMALVHDPQIVVLDEPDAGLDPQSRVKVREYIQSLAQEKTVILTTHNMDEAERLADRVGIIDHGRLLVLDTPQSLKMRLGEGDVLEVELSQPLADEGLIRASLCERLGKQDVQFTLNPNHRLVTLRGLNMVTALAPLQEILEENGLESSEVRLRQNSLEDVFIHLTGRSLRE